MDTNKLLPPFPDSWFVVAFSDELPPGKLLTRQFMGQDLIIFRTQSGTVGALDPYCAHLGAHLGYGGTVEGEVIRCPFHRFCFDPQGNCVATGYGTRPPPKAKMRAWPVQEKHGLILVYYHHQGKAPEWEVPELESEGWSPLRWKVLRLRTHPQEIYENSVDQGHFSILHQYAALEQLGETVTQGPHLYAHYAMYRRARFLGPLFNQGPPAHQTAFDVFVHGLGYSLTLVKIPDYGAQARLFTLATPADNAGITLRLAHSQQLGPHLKKFHPALAGAASAGQCHRRAGQFFRVHPRYGTGPGDLGKQVLRAPARSGGR